MEWSLFKKYVAVFVRECVYITHANVLMSLKLWGLHSWIVITVLTIYLNLAVNDWKEAPWFPVSEIEISVWRFHVTHVLQYVMYVINCWSKYNLYRFWL